MADCMLYTVQELLWISETCAPMWRFLSPLWVSFCILNSNSSHDLWSNNRTRKNMNTFDVLCIACNQTPAVRTPSYQKWCTIKQSHKAPGGTCLRLTSSEWHWAHWTIIMQLEFITQAESEECFKTLVLTCGVQLLIGRISLLSGAMETNRV